MTCSNTSALVNGGRKYSRTTKPMTPTTKIVSRIRFFLDSEASSSMRLATCFYELVLIPQFIIISLLLPSFQEHILMHAYTRSKLPLICLSFIVPQPTQEILKISKIDYIF